MNPSGMQDGMNPSGMQDGMNPSGAGWNGSILCIRQSPIQNNKYQVLHKHS